MEGGNSASPPGGRTAETILETIQNDNGDLYKGEVKDGKRHGRGRMEWVNGAVYDGEWKDGVHHGIGTYTHANGSVYEGGWVEGKQHGWVTVKGIGGQTYVGEVEEGKMHGWGELTYAGGEKFEGNWTRGKRHGKGVFKWKDGEVCEGQWVEGKRHGRCTITKASGEVFDGEWVDGQRVWAKARGVGTSPSASEGKQSEMEKRTNEQPTKDQRRYVERTLRSTQSQQRRMEKNVEANKCEHCGASDEHYKLRVCSGCNLALYCSAACQKAARRSHHRICDISSQLPSRDSTSLLLEYDKDKMIDLDARLHYAANYMDNMKHLRINIKEIGKDDTIKLSVKRLSSLLKSKRGALESFFWLNVSSQVNLLGKSKIGHAMRNELEGLKQLRLRGMKSDEVRPLGDIVGQQKHTLMVLCLAYLQIDWSKAKTRRTIAQAAGSCTHLVKLDLTGCVLMDSDLKIMLQDLPSLRILNLTRDADNSHEFTDNTCGLIARKCPGLQELELYNHDQLSVRGIRKIFEGCVQLRSFCTTTCKLSSCDIRSLLDSAPQLLCLSLGKRCTISCTELDEIIEATGGRTAFRFGLGEYTAFYEPKGEMISAKTKEKYQHQKKIVCTVWSKSGDPNVANEWEELL